jgi:hypothetical protein
MQIMATDNKRFNYWSPQADRQNFEILSTPVFMTGKKVVFPNLNDANKDGLILVAESAMHRAMHQEIFRKESLPPETELYAEITPRNNPECDFDTLFRLCLAGGIPLFKWDILIENAHTEIEFRALKSVVGDVSKERDESIQMARKMERNSKARQPQILNYSKEQLEA